MAERSRGLKGPRGREMRVEAERSRGLKEPRGRERRGEAYLKTRYNIFYCCHFENMPTMAES